FRKPAIPANTRPRPPPTTPATRPGERGADRYRPGQGRPGCRRVTAPPQRNSDPPGKGQFRQAAPWLAFRVSRPGRPLQISMAFEPDRSCTSGCQSNPRAALRRTAPTRPPQAGEKQPRGYDPRPAEDSIAVPEICGFELVCPIAPLL